MALDKAIASGKEHRKPYRKSKAIDSSCRNNGSCSWCVGNRTHKAKVAAYHAKMQLEESLYEDES